MSTFTWTTGQSGDWGVAGNWSPAGIPDASDATAILPGVASAGYIVTIGSGESETVNSITLGDVVGNHVGPTLDVAGTLTFAGANAEMNFASGTMEIGSTGVLDGSGALGLGQGPGPYVLTNDGTVEGDAGSNIWLTILTGFSNAGTVLANNGLVGIEGPAGLTNLSGTTLTGGTWIAQGPTAGTFNLIVLGYNFDAVVAVDAANIILDGMASDIYGYAGATGNSNNFQPIEQQLQTIAPTGTLQLLDSRGYSTSNVLSDQGTLIFQGDTISAAGLTVTATGTLDGFGVVIGGIANQGVIIANGGSAGALDINGAVSGSGALTVTPGSALVLAGGAQSAITNNGILYDTSGLLAINSLAGSGTLVVQNGATIELGAVTTQDVAFSGSSATLKLDNFAGYGGTLVGFAQGDTLVLAGTAATKAFMSGSTLVVVDNTSTVDTISLAGSYAPGASFSVTNVGTNAVITNTGGAPIQQNFRFVVDLNDPLDLGGTQDAAIVQDLSAAAEDWAQYLTGHTTLRIQLNIVSGSIGEELANGSPTTNISSGTMLDGRLLDTPSSLIALNTGNYVPGLSSDITINLLASNLPAIYVNPSPTPKPSGTIAADQYDLVTVFRHELAHGFGFGGLTDQFGNLGTQETWFDHFIQSPAGTVVFTGPNAEAAYGALLGTGIATPVPLTTLNNGEGYAHFANSTLDVNATDLMTGLGLPPGTQRDISPMDLAVLQDIGVPVTASVGVVCYACGTRMATSRGEVPIEELMVGDIVLTASGQTAPIVWIGRRRIDCRRHPQPNKVWPVRIHAHAFAANMPRRDLLVSPQHGLYIGGVLIPACCLINGGSVAQIDPPAIEYFHIELARHDLLLAEGMPAESYLDAGDRAMFDNGGAVVTLHADFASRVWESRGCAPLKLVGPEVEAVRRRLAERAARMSPRHGRHGARSGVR